MLFTSEMLVNCDVYNFTSKISSLVIPSALHTSEVLRRIGYTVKIFSLSSTCLRTTLEVTGDHDVASASST